MPALSSATWQPPLSRNRRYCIAAPTPAAQVLKYVQTFKFTGEHIGYLRTLMPDADEGFWGYLEALDCSELKIWGIADGTVVFPREPLLRIEGPLAVAQLLETTVLNLCNFSSLITTNAARFRLAAGKDKQLLEFGLRRAQGPDGAMTASRYAYMGGFDATSNVAAGLHFGISPRGTHAHSMVSAYSSLDELPSRLLDGVDIVALALKYRAKLGYNISSIGEMAAFISFAQAFPNNFLALVDTYDTLQSGVPNFICVALALRDIGRTPVGIRLDSGDLAYLSKETRRMFKAVDAQCGSNLAACTIVASNDINEAVLLSLADQGHEIDSFGIGTNLVTCQAQPALGMVFKLVEINGLPRIKLSQDMAKVTIPGAKEVFRLIGSDGVPLLDLIIRAGETRPMPGRRMLCRHPFDETKRAYVTPKAVMPLLRLVWKGGRTTVSEALTSDPLLATTTPASATATASGHVPPELGLLPVADGRKSAAADAAADGAPGSSSGGASGGAGGADGSSGGGGIISPSALPEGVNMRARIPPLGKLREFVQSQLSLMREDHLRPLNPTPYKVSVSTDLYHYIHDLWMKEVPIPELE